MTEREAKRRAAYEAWKGRVNEVLMLRIGLIDEELCEQTARFLVREAWLISGHSGLEDRHVLLIAKAVACENRRETMTPEQMARQFNAAAGRPRPAVPTPELDQVWFDCIDEEVQELRDAYAARDLVEIADALGDITYTVAGAADSIGLPFDAILAEVHRSGMTKFGPDGRPEAVRADGKVVKGPHFEPPQIAALIDITPSGDTGKEAGDEHAQ